MCCVTVWWKQRQTSCSCWLASLELTSRRRNPNKVITVKLRITALLNANEHTRTSCIDPYSSTKGWVGRRPRPQSDSADPDSPSGTARSTPDTAGGYLYGSPSERFPSARGALSELDEEEAERDSDDESISSTRSNGTDNQDQGTSSTKVDLDFEHEWSSAENALQEDDE